MGEATRRDAGAAEQGALRRSAWAYLGMAALGIGFALLTRSGAVLLDGVYSLVSCGAALLALRVARFVETPSSEGYHFGFAKVEPMLNAMRGLLILGIGAFAAVSAVDALLHGGRAVSAGWGVVYGVAAAAGCLAMAWSQQRTSRTLTSPLLAADARNWMIDGLLSSATAAAFLLAFLLRDGDGAHLVPYVDPGLVLLLVLVTVRVPLSMIVANLREMVMAAPAEAQQADVRSRVEGATGDLPVEMLRVRMAPIGRYFYVMVHVILPADWQPTSLRQIDDARCRVARALEGIHARPVLDVLFTSDRRWAETLDPSHCRE